MKQVRQWKLRDIGISRQAMMIAVIPVLLMALLLGGYGLYARFAEQDRFLVERAITLVKQLAATSEYPVFSGNRDLLRRNAEATLAQHDVKRVLFYDSRGQVMLDTAARQENPADGRLPLRPGQGWQMHEDENALWLYEPIYPTAVGLGWPEEAADRPSQLELGGVMLEVGKDGLNHGKNTILLVSILVTLGVCLFSLAMAYRSARKVTRPIKSLNEAIHAIGQGRLDTRMEPLGVRELDTLAEGVNTMASLLHEERVHLEERIESATEEIRQKKEQAENTSREKSRFLAAAGHDLRQPLAAANLFLDALHLTQVTPHQENLIQRLEQAMSTFNGMLNALLDISRLDSGAVQPEYRSVGVMELFAWVDRNCGPSAMEKRLDFSFWFPQQEVLSVRCDASLVQSVLMNLVTNAIKYTNQGGILVSARRRGENVLIQVWDTGVGIPADALPRIFDEFYQVNNPQRDRSRGLGLGLSIARRALAVQGGELSCRSREGHGSVFSFTLPCAECGAVEAEADEAGEGERPSPDRYVRGKRFILAEDDILVSQAMATLLRGLGAEVSVYRNADDVYAHSGIGEADWIISDFMLDGRQNGIQMLQTLQERLGRPLRAMLMTGDTSPAFMAGLPACPWPVLHKPIRLAALLAVLAQA